MLNPNISSAANDRISLTGGIQWLGKQPDRPDGKKNPQETHPPMPIFGAGFGLHQNHGFKRIRTFQRLRAKQFRTEIWRTAYILSRF